MNIGDSIKFYRKKNGISQGHLAFALGLNRSTISRYESGLICLTQVMQLQNMAKVFGITLDTLISSIGDVPTGETASSLARLSKDEYYLKIAEVVALRSTCLRRQYGAVIVNNEEIIATGYNGAPRGEINCSDAGQCYCRKNVTPLNPNAAAHGSQYGSCVAVHAEQNVLISASRKDMQGATLYLATLDPAVDPNPCNFCDRMIKNAGIVKVVTKAGAL